MNKSHLRNTLQLNITDNNISPSPKLQTFTQGIHDSKQRRPINPIQLTLNEEKPKQKTNIIYTQTQSDYNRQNYIIHTYSGMLSNEFVPTRPKRVIGTAIYGHFSRSPAKVFPQVVKQLPLLCSPWVDQLNLIFDVPKNQVTFFQPRISHKKQRQRLPTSPIIRDDKLQGSITTRKSVKNETVVKNDSISVKNDSTTARKSMNLATDIRQSKIRSTSFQNYISCNKNRYNPYKISNNDFLLKQHTYTSQDGS